MELFGFRSQPGLMRVNMNMVREIKGVDDIRLMVDAFYERASQDELLAPIFMTIKDSSPHKELLYRYWVDQILKEGSDPDTFPEHIRLMFSSQHFIRWLGLFLQTIDSLYRGALAEKAKIILIRKSEEFQTKLEFLRF